jgi:hypothetical protein
MVAITNDMRVIRDYMPKMGGANEWHTATLTLKNDPEIYGLILSKTSTDRMLTLRTRKGTEQIPNVL